MKNKVLAILLCVCMLLPCFAIFALAEEGMSANANEDVYVPEDLYQMIDVQAYIDNAGKEGYNQMKVLGFSDVSINVETESDSGVFEEPIYSISLRAYIYNPNLIPIVNSTDYCLFHAEHSGYDCYEHHPVSYAQIIGSDGLPINYVSSGTILPEHDVLHEDLNISDNDHYHWYDAMFFEIGMGFIVRESDYIASGMYEGKFLIDTMSFYTYSGERIIHDDTYEWKQHKWIEHPELYHEVVVNIGAEINYKNIAEMLNYTTAYTDMSSFLDIDIATLNNEYPKKPDYSEITPAFLYEDLENKRLFLYVYDSLARGVLSSSFLNRIDISLDNINYKDYTLRLVNFENTLSKFEIIVGDEFFENINSTQSRTYYINHLEYRSDLNTWCTSDDFVKYTYTTDKEGELNVDVEADFIRLKEVGDTFYRLNSSANGDNLYQTLSSVYFSIPESYFELDDNDYLNDRWLENIKGKYDWAYTNPGIVTSNKELKDKIYKDYLSGKGINTSYMVDPYIDNHNLLQRTIYADLFLGGDVNDFEIITWLEAAGLALREEFPYKGFYKNYSVLFYVDEIGAPNSLAIDGLTLETALLNSDYAFSEYHKDEPFELSRNEVKNLLSVKELSVDDFYKDHSLWDTLMLKWFDYSESIQDSVKNIKVFQTFEGAQIRNALAMSKEDFVSQYYVSASDYSDICKRMQYALDNDEVFLLIRFDTYDYFAAHPNDVSKYGAYQGSAGEYEKDVVLFIDKYYSDFEVLEMELKNSYDSKVYNIKMTPISFIAGVTVPDVFNPWEDTNVPDLPDLPDMPDISDIFKPKNKDNPIMMIVGMILIITLAIVIVKFVLVPIVRAIRKQ